MTTRAPIRSGHSSTPARRRMCTGLVPLLIALGGCEVRPNAVMGDGGPNAGDMAGANGDAGGGDTMCAEVDRRCPRSFLYAGTPMAPVTGDEISVEVRGSYRADAWSSGDKMTWDGNAKAYKAVISVPWVTRYSYKFRVVDRNGGEKWLADPNNPNSEPDGFGGMNSITGGVTCADYTCPDKPTPPPPGAWDWHDAVMYFVFVDRFLNGNNANDMPVNANGLRPPANWQGGDWAGVTQKINEGYFQALGANTLWITVPMDNSDGAGIGDDGQLYSAYHGYWPRDVSKPERRFGSEAELSALVDAAHKAGIKILIDYAMNHVHRDSPVFQQHQNDGWFNPLNVNGGQCICGSNACPWDGPTAEVCWFRDYLPDFNFGNNDARKFSVENALYWIKTFGVDGFRLDAVKHIRLQWLLDLRGRLTAEVEPTLKQHVYLVGETYTGDQGLIKSFIDPARMLDGQFDFPLRAQMMKSMFLKQDSMQALAGFMDSNQNFYGTGAIMSTFIGNHDVPRTIHFAEDSPLWGDVWSSGRDRSWNNTPGQPGSQNAYERMAAALAVLMTNKGIPLLYYGDEVGLAGGGDPDNRRFMQWSNYSGGQALLLDRVKKMGAFRAAHPATRRGARSTVALDGDAWVYRLDYSENGMTDRVFVAVNRADSPKNMNGLASMALKDAISGDTITGPNVTIPARGVRLLAP